MYGNIQVTGQTETLTFLNMSSKLRQKVDKKETPTQIQCATMRMCTEALIKVMGKISKR